jgi:uncharacterized protein
MNPPEGARLGTLLIRGGEIPLPVEVRDTHLGLVTIASVDEPITLAPGLYAISVLLPGRPDFHALVDVAGGEQRILDVRPEQAGWPVVVPQGSSEVVEVAVTLLEEGKLSAAMHVLTNSVPDLPSIGLVLLGFTALRVNDMVWAQRAVELVPGAADVDRLALQAAVLRETWSGEEATRQKLGRLGATALQLGSPRLTASAQVLVAVLRDSGLPPSGASRALLRLVRGANTSRVMLPDATPTSVRGRPPQSRELMALKVVVAGGSGTGKTAFVASVSEIRPLLTEAAIGDLAGEEFRPGQRHTTTVAFDFGRVTVDEDRLLYLFGMPGQARFWYLWDELILGAVGAVVVADTRRLADCFAAIDFFERHGLPYIVALNQFEGEPRYTVHEVSEALGIGSDVPVMFFDARDRVAARDVLNALLEYVAREPRDTFAHV